MATLDWPAGLLPARVELALVQAGAQAISPHNGALESKLYVAERWRMGITLPPVAASDGYRVHAFLRKLVLGKTQVRLGPYLRAQYVPQGTMRGSPVLASAASRGDEYLSISTTAGATLFAGDFIGCGGHLFEVSDDCIASSGGALTAPISNRPRVSIASGTAVVWNQPKAEFALPAASVPFVSSPAIFEAITLDFIETWGINAIAPTTGVRTVINAGGISSAVAFGNSSVSNGSGRSISGAGGIASGQAFGTSVVSNGSIKSITSAGAIASAGAFGTAVVSRKSVKTVTSAGAIASAAAFGTTVVNVTVALAWDANPGGDNVTGYNLYRGTSSGSYTLYQSLGNVTSVTVQLPGGVNYLALTAVNATGESGFSNEIHT